MKELDQIATRPGEIIIKEGGLPEGIVVAHSGYFLAFRSDAAGIARRSVVYTGPSLFGLPKSDTPEHNPYTIKALDGGES